MLRYTHIAACRVLLSVPLFPLQNYLIEYEKLWFQRLYVNYVMLMLFQPCVVGPCHHGMARPQVADRGTASNMEGSCE